MNSSDFESLIEIARRKNRVDQSGDWSNGSTTYLDEVRKELHEVEEEIRRQRLCYLEDELADVLWDYLNAVVCLEQEQGVSLDRVLSRGVGKYAERVSAIESGEAWSSVKTRQKRRLREEFETRSPEGA